MPRKYAQHKKCKRPYFGKVDRFVGKSAYHLGKKALSMLNVEYKCFEVQLTNNPITDTGVISQCTNIPQGDTVQSRDGNQLKITQMIFNYMITSNVSSVSSAVRVMIVHDKQTNGAIWTPADLFADASVFDVQVSPLNIDNNHRFRILYNKLHVIPFGSARSAVNRRFIKKMALKLRFKSSTPSIADLTQDSLSVFMVSNEATNTPTVTFNMRLRYVDN